LVQETGRPRKRAGRAFFGDRNAKITASRLNKFVKMAETLVRALSGGCHCLGDA
jgi:hypothetical protein